MRISELAAATGVAARLLRHYEEQGLLTPGRDARGWRTYTAADRERVERIRDLVSSGLPTGIVARLLAADGGTVDGTIVTDVADYRDRLDRRIACLGRNRDALDGWLAAARGGRPPA